MDDTPLDALVEIARPLLFTPGAHTLVIRTSDDPEDDSEHLVCDANEAAEFLGGAPGQVLLQTFDADGKPTAYVGLAAVMNADHYLPPTCISKRSTDGMRVGIWRLDTPIPVTDTKNVQALEDIARGLGNESAADPAPLPGADGWEITEAHPDRVYSLDALKRAPARVVGSVDPGILNRPVKMAMSIFGKDQSKGKYRGFSGTVGNVVYTLAQHPMASKKDGSHFLSGSLVKGAERVANAVDVLYWLTLDLDCGDDAQTIRKRIQELGLFAVLHTSWSHGTEKTEVKKDSVLSWIGKDATEASCEQVRAYLMDVKRYRPDVLEGATLEGTFHTKEGIKYRLQHQRMARLRVWFLLEKPFVIAERAARQAEAIAEWRDRYRGMAKVLDVVADRSCVDPSRLWFLPRHPTEATEFFVEVFAGKALDIDSIDRVSERDERNPFDAAARAMGGDKKQYVTANMLAFAAKHGDVFEAADCMQELDPDCDRGPAPGGGLTCRCPNDYEHTRAGDPDDAGCFVVNASNSKKGGFVIWCEHDACKGKLDRLDHLDLFCQQVGIEDATELCKWCPETVENDEESEEEDQPAQRGRRSKKQKPKPDNEALFQKFSKE